MPCSLFSFVPQPLVSLCEVHEAFINYKTLHKFAQVGPVSNTSALKRYQGSCLGKFRADRSCMQ